MSALPSTIVELSPAAEADPARATAQELQQIVEQADVGICITIDGVLQYVNPKFAQMHRCSAADLLGTELLQVVHPQERERVAEIRRLRELGQHQSAYESRNRRFDGSTFDTRIFGRAITFRGHQASLTTVSDITELAEANRVSSWRARMLISTELLCRSGSVEFSVPERSVRVSRGTRALLQLHAGARQTPLLAALRMVPADERRLVIGRWRDAVPGEPFEFCHRLRRVDGQVLRVLHRGLIEVVAGDRPNRPVAILQDITEQTAAEAQIDRLVNYHPVTGLATRALLLRRAADAVDLALRERRSLAMLFLRVPHVGRVLGALGLTAGEALAATLASRLLTGCRPEDTAAHLGGGEFAILLEPGAGADEPQALTAAARILAALATPATVNDAELVIDGQIGIARFPADASGAAELLENAHAACGRGGAAISFFTREAGESAARGLRLEGALRRAFERQEFSLHYQPQVDLKTGTIIGAEALLRWHSDEFGEVSPAEFVPIAEEIGLILPLGEWVFRTACEQSAAWERDGLPALRVAVNLSPRQLEQRDLSERLQSIILDTGADPSRLGIEITESVLTRDFEGARRMLNELSAIGIEIALDDFGTGYSNLSVLRALPFDVLKIDRSLVHDVTAAPEDVSITRAVLMLAQGLRIKVLAEGVETEGQLNLLISNGCELMQGFIFSRPLPADAFEQMLRDGLQLPAQYLDRKARRRGLLIVDDEENVLSSLRRLLRGAGYHIVVARSGVEGLAKLAEHDIDVIISDQRMPGMTGVEFLRRAKELYPDTVRMVLSGYTELQSITDAVNEGAIYKFLTKPWDDDRLREHVAEAFRRKELVDENFRLATQVRETNVELTRANERQQALLTQQRERLSLEEVRAINAQDLLENLPTAVLGIDADGMVAFVNRQARALLNTGPPLVGGQAAQVLPPDWVGAWRSADGRHRPTHAGDRACLLSCAPIEAAGNGGAPRGHLLTLIPMPEPLRETGP